MATATFAEDVQDKTQEELVEACFKVHLEIRILMASKTGPQVPQRLAFATDKFKQKLDNKAREEIILLYSQACEKLGNMKKDEESKPSQRSSLKKRKVLEAELPDDEG